MAVKTKDIVIGGTYAVKIGDELHRFHVRSITSVRHGPSPSQIKITVDGLLHVLDGTKAMQFDKEKLLGEYTFYEELVAARKAEDEARERRKAEQIATGERAAALLEAVGIKTHRQSWSTHVEIRAEELPKLIDYLNGRITDKA